MNQDASTKKLFVLKILLVLFAVACLAVGLIIILKNNILNVKQKDLNDKELVSELNYSDISPAPGFIDHLFSESLMEIPLADIKSPEYYSFSAKVDDFNSYSTYDVTVCGSMYKIVGDDRTVMNDSNHADIDTPYYHIVYDNEQFDMFSEIGIVSLEYVQDVVRSFPDSVFSGTY